MAPALGAPGALRTAHTSPSTSPPALIQHEFILNGHFEHSRGRFRVNCIDGDHVCIKYHGGEEFKVPAADLWQECEHWARSSAPMVVAAPRSSSKHVQRETENRDRLERILHALSALLEGSLPDRAALRTCFGTENPGKNLTARLRALGGRKITTRSNKRKDKAKSLLAAFEADREADRLEALHLPLEQFVARFQEIADELDGGPNATALAQRVVEIPFAAWGGWNSAALARALSFLDSMRPTLPPLRTWQHADLALAYLGHAISLAATSMDDPLFAPPPPDRADLLGRLLARLREARRLDFRATRARIERERIRPEDVLLALHYNQEDCFDVLASAASPSLSEIERHFKSRGDKGPQALRAFNVLGLQPRVAELAFAELYRAASRESALSDLNLEALGGADRPLPGRIRLPAADFKAPGAGAPLDVKCNVCWGDKPRGLRGFWIDPRGLPSEDLHGLVVEAWDTRGWSLCYIGALNARSADRLDSALGLKVELRGKRARYAPFLFSLPPVFRLAVPEVSTPVAASIGELGVLANSPELALLAAYELGDMDRARLEERCRESMEPARLFLAELLHRVSFGEWDLAPAHLWAASLHGLGTVRDQLGVDAGREFLEAAKRLTGGWTLPIVLPGATEARREGYFAAWVDEVLAELNSHWDAIRCPRCRERPTRVLPTSLTEQGILLGRIECGGCGWSEERTLVAHCSKCGRYPLLAGREEPCPAGADCGGLLCPDDGACRPRCPARSTEARG